MDSFLTLTFQSSSPTMICSSRSGSMLAFSSAYNNVLLDFDLNINLILHLTDCLNWCYSIQVFIDFKSQSGSSSFSPSFFRLPPHSMDGEPSTSDVTAPKSSTGDVKTSTGDVKSSAPDVMGPTPIDDVKSFSSLFKQPSDSFGAKSDVKSDGFPRVPDSSEISQALKKIGEWKMLWCYTHFFIWNLVPTWCPKFF